MSSTPNVGESPRRRLPRSDFKFTPKKIEIDASTTLEIVLVDKGNVAHSWAIPELDTYSDRIQPGKETSITLNPDPGTYKIACQVPGHEQVGMVGKLVVGEAGSDDEEDEDEKDG